MSRLYRKPYKALGIASDATEKEIRKAYRRLAMKYHPDRNPGDPEAEEKFKEVQWVYETLVKQKDRRPPTPSDQHVRSAHHFSGDKHSFFGFFWAVRNHYAKRKVS